MSLFVVPPTRKHDPRVSVIIPAFNAGRTIDTALQSVFAQTFSDLEVIVVDDGSSDDTTQRVRAWGDRVILHRQANAGPAAARNHGMRHARGELIAFLDADDVWLPTKLARQVAYFDQFPETGLLHCHAITTNATLSVMLETPERPAGPFTAPINNYCALFHCDFFVKTLTVVVPRRVIQDVGGFDERREFHIEDWDLWLRIAAKYPMGYMRETLAIHRPDGGMSSNVEKTFRGQKLVMEKALPLCAQACARHREDPRACVGTREHLLHSQLGYERFWRGHTRTARAAYQQAVAIDPSDLRGRTYVTASYLLPPAVARRRRRVPRKDILQDTTFRRVRSSVIRTLHAADEALLNWRGGPRRILFEAASPLSMAVFQPIYDRMRHDDRVEFWFTAAADDSWEPMRIFQGAGVAARVISRDKIRWQKFHGYINTDFWTTTWLPRRTCRFHLFHGVAGKYDLDSPTKIAPVVSTFDRLMFANVDRLNRYADAGLVDPESPKAALIGYPKVDCLVDGSLDRAAIMSSLGLDPRKPTVLYAPTWSPYSSLNMMGEEILTSLAALDVNVIVKLHDRSLEVTERGSGGVDWRARIRQLSQKRAVHLAEASNASPYLFVADALVTDHSSVGFEFMLLDRPIIVVHSPELLRHGRINPQKAALLQSAAHVIQSAGAITGTVSHALEHPTALSRIRRDVADDLFYRPGSATTRAVNCIYELLGLSAMVTVPVAAPEPEPVATVHIRPLQMGARRT